MTKISLFGASGRMGRAIAAAAQRRDDVAVGPDGDIYIDFTAPDALEENVATAVAAAKPLVIGTTGLDEAHHRVMEDAATKIPLLYAANMALGVNLLAHLVREAAARLGPEWDIEIVEMHHRHKVDAPSGTALLLGEAAAEGRGVSLGDVREAAREGKPGPRASGAIGFAALRGGSVAGDHQLIFAGEGERIELGHRAESRAIFAEGAIRAALWLSDRAPGRYSMRDVLGIA